MKKPFLISRRGHELFTKITKIFCGEHTLCSRMISWLFLYVRVHQFNMNYTYVFPFVLPWPVNTTLWNCVTPVSTYSGTLDESMCSWGSLHLRGIRGDPQLWFFVARSSLRLQQSCSMFVWRRPRGFMPSVLFFPEMIPPGRSISAASLSAIPLGRDLPTGLAEGSWLANIYFSPSGLQ